VVFRGSEHRLDRFLSCFNPEKLDHEIGMWQDKSYLCLENLLISPTFYQRQEIYRINES
jgi:hypothetical protein